MKIALNWLKDYCTWDWSLEELVEKLTMSGTEVEAIHHTGFQIDHIIAAKVLEFTQHPNADRLRLCQVDDGSGTSRQIVCGAKNFNEGDIVPLALPGAVMPPNEKAPEGFKIKKSKLRGEVSEGMMCAGAEIGISDDAEGLLIMSADTQVGMPLKDLYKGDIVLEMEVTPNRPDLLSYLGMSRELIALGAKEASLAFTQQASSPVETKPQSKWKVNVKDAQACPRYTAVEIENVKVGPSPDWLKQRLEDMGLRPVNNIVDITNYVLFELGQPLHAFDADEIDGQTMVVRDAEANEKFHALNQKQYELQKGDLVVADESSILALAGVIGGEPSSVTEKTTRILLESASFHPQRVRRTSRRLSLISDSSYRFERGLDPKGVNLARQRAVALIKEIAGGNVVGDALESAEYQKESRTVALRKDRLEKILGYEVQQKRVTEILQALGCLEDKSGHWQIPSYRADLRREIDMIEEIARIEGLKKVPARLKFGVASESCADKAYDGEMKLRRFIQGLGFQEVSTYSLITLEDAHAVTLRNPLNEDLKHIRSSLLDSVLPSVKVNVSREMRDLRLFEIGSVYYKNNHSVHEERRLLILLTGDEREQHWTEEGRPTDFYTLKGVVDKIKQAFPAGELSDSAELGVVDRLKLKTLGIKQSVFAAELRLDWNQVAQSQSYQMIPTYPSVSRDLALVVDRHVKQEAIYTAIASAGIDELESVHCFDLFQDDRGEKLPQNQKSLAYSLVFRSKERTLTDKDVNAWEKAILKKVNDLTGALLR
ncbi:MAG: phenylalanine--tRNA ligase subunit beta [Verrucomicrobiota bacterium]